jgi:hypothetical protein
MLDVVPALNRLACDKQGENRSSGVTAEGGARLEAHRARFEVPLFAVDIGLPTNGFLLFEDPSSPRLENIAASCGLRARTADFGSLYPGY